MDLHPIAGVVWYAIGRFYEAQDGQQLDLGYFAHLGGLGPLFNGPPGEATAFFTFRAEPFRVQTLQNGDLSVSLDATGVFTLYLNREPCGDFADPDTFSRGEPIATFERFSTAVGTTVGPLASNLFSAALRSSRDFVFGGGTWNLARLVPEGITQLGTASTTALPPPRGYKAVRAFVGSAMALGARRG
ncbi:hypothetical protein D187_006176 [Cystobacter fuscus DSM 2262]|uniref:Uncharacterized protein n=1 Tax=Cystobacter fuscus (strain ATCC 25194 / DSM 2262 / NBRC 100088 / M29) TaxID=1242864 RepID=S9PMS4_CYSF2|nr:hypothetical protein [Cystobacter fuscus]EPX63767.1 hypothetical protein D187_006176 [Cystobacter fuscus DSM 2262]